MTQYQKPQDWTEVLTSAGPYPIEAYDFVRDGLSFTTQQLHDDDDRLPRGDRHISGQELCLGLRDFAIDRYGLLALSVLNSWNITRTEDFGRIVYAMIDAGLMTRTDDDSPEDFRGVYNFSEAFAREDLVARIACCG
jgi:uncharacterized repeat protein (TIGR04138 family)